MNVLQTVREPVMRYTYFLVISLVMVSKVPSSKAMTAKFIALQKSAPREEFICLDGQVKPIDELLFKSCRDNNSQEAQAAIANGANVLIKSTQTDLMPVDYAITHNNAALCALLLARQQTVEKALENLRVEDFTVIQGRPVASKDVDLWLACRTNTLAKAIAALNEQASVTVTHRGTGIAPLHMAAYHANTALELLLRRAARNAPPTQPGSEELECMDKARGIHEIDYLLMRACKAGNLRRLREAHALGASAQIKTQNTKESPADFAIARNDSALTAYILEAGGGFEPAKLFVLAMNHKNENILLLLRRHAPQAAKQVVSSLLSHGLPHIAEAYIQAGAPLDDRALFQALELNFDSVACLLLSPDPLFSKTNVACRVNVNARFGGTTPVILASKKNKDYIVGQLLAWNADTTAREDNGHSALWYACYNNNTPLALKLIHSGASTDARAVKPKEQDHLIQKLDMQAVDHQAQEISDAKPYNESVSELWTPLLLAASSTDIQVVDALLTRGADPAIPLNLTNKTALHVALTAQGPYVRQCVERLAHVQQLLNAPDLHGSTPLHYVSDDLQYKELLKILIQAGADVNKADLQGKTPLHLACEKGILEIVETLLQSKSVISKIVVASALQIVHKQSHEGLKSLLTGYYNKHYAESSGIARRGSMSGPGPSPLAVSAASPRTPQRTQSPRTGSANQSPRGPTEPPPLADGIHGIPVLVIHSDPNLAGSLGLGSPTKK